MDKENVLEAAIDRAIDAIPEDFITKPFLEAHRAEVKGMLLTEYNEARTMELFKEEGREEGRIEGRAEGRIEGRAEGVDRFAQLINALSRMRRFDDAEKAARDAAYRDALFDEFHIA